MEQKAEQLPKDGVPPEIVRLLPHDTTLDKLMVQKNATPCDGARGSVGAAARDIGLRTPNAVAMEKSSVDEVDHNKLRAGAFANLAGKARRDPDAVAVGAAPAIRRYPVLTRSGVLFCAWRACGFRDAISSNARAAGTVPRALWRERAERTTERQAQTWVRCSTGRGSSWKRTCPVSSTSCTQGDE